MSSYSKLAQFYDMFTDNDCDYNKWSQYLSIVLEGHNATKGVDLACGTGKMTRLLSKMGYDVIGIDSSSDMLNIATSQGGRVKYICQDMMNVSLPKKVDFVTIVNDGVNYISQEQLPELFGRIYNILTDKGVLIFDISSSYKLINIIGNNVFYRDMPDVTCLWSNQLTEHTVNMDITLFHTKDGTTYTRQDEQHLQYIHSHSDIVHVLQQLGYNTTIVDCYSDKAVSDKTQRITFIATKG